MVRGRVWLTIGGGLLLAMGGAAWGQAMAEAGLGTARAATGTAPAAGLGKAMSGLAGSLDKALKTGQPAAEIRPAKTAASAAAPTPKVPPETGEAAPAAGPAAKREDPSGIEAGVSYAELLRRFGPPCLEITGETGRTLTYIGKTGAFHVEIEDDRVTSVRPPRPQP